MPQKICLPCHQDLENIYEFRKKCEFNNKRLKQHLKAVEKGAKTADIKKTEDNTYGYDVEDLDNDQNVINLSQLRTINYMGQNNNLEVKPINSCSDVMIGGIHFDNPISVRTDVAERENSYTDILQSEGISEQVNFKRYKLL